MLIDCVGIIQGYVMPYHVLFIDDDKAFLDSVRICLKNIYQVSTAPTIQAGLGIIHTDSVDLVFLDVNLNHERSGIQYIKTIKDMDPSVVVIMLSGYKDPDIIVEAIKEGAGDYLCKPYPHSDLLAVIKKNLNRKNDNDQKEALFEYCNLSNEKTTIITESQNMIAVLAKAKKLKGYDANVLIEGESGTGKEVLAQYIHSLEANTKRPFIAVNCAAIPENLLESELFGHEKGAFTGADKRKIGKFELAGGGDLFLDEVDSLKPEFQAKLLRVLQEKEFYRVGGTMPIKVKLRVLVATNKNLTNEVLAGRFREDLFYRLRVISLVIPSLKERQQDIEPLTQFFIQKAKIKK